MFSLNLVINVLRICKFILPVVLGGIIKDVSWWSGEIVISSKIKRDHQLF